jgi:hypothetical protein
MYRKCINMTLPKRGKGIIGYHLIQSQEGIVQPSIPATSEAELGFQKI